MARVLFAVVVVQLLACGDDGDGPRAPRAHGGEGVGGQIVATVDGVGITISDIEAMVATANLPPDEALARLEEQELLAAEARRRGFDDQPAVELAATRARVQRFLAQNVEGVVTPASIPDAAILERYEALSARYQAPERRASTHLLVEVPEGADETVWLRADAHAADVLRRATRGEPDAVISEAARAPAPAGLSLRREELPPFAADGDLEAPYLAALFSTLIGTVHPRTVRTRYGVHVIFVRAVEPAVDISLDEATPEIREALVIEGRRVLLGEILERVAAERTVDVSQEAAARALSLEIGS